MLNVPTLEKLKQMRLWGMARAFEEQLSCDSYTQLSFEERLALMIEREQTERDNKRMVTRLRQAKLRQNACMEDIAYEASRGLDKSMIQSMGSCQWIVQKLNSIITGPCGAGKSFIACALGHRACLEGYKVLYFRCPRLFHELGVARGDGRYLRLMKTIAKSDVLIIDDWGLSSPNERERLDLLEIMEERHNLHSTIIVSQIPVEHWHELIGDETLADAIMDRLVHNAYKIKLKGGSMRKKRAKLG